MSTRTWIASCTAIWRHKAVQTVLLTLYYLAILAALVAIYGPGHYKSPPFIYQGF